MTDRIADLERWLVKSTKENLALEADNKRLREDIASADAQIEALEAKLGPDCCACPYDKPGDVCRVHSPMLRKAEAEIKRLREELEAADDSLKPLRVFVDGQGRL